MQNKPNFGNIDIVNKKNSQHIIKFKFINFKMPK